MDLEKELAQGWDALDTAALDRARACAEALGAHHGDDPEVHLFRGAVAEATGDRDGAKAAYARASELDPEYVEPLLRAAQLLCDEGDLREARRLTERAVDAAEEEDEYVDALLAKAELELGDEDEAAALATLEELAPVDLPDPHFHLRAGALLFELDRLDDAERHFEAARRNADTEADALHGLGRVAGARGDEATMVARFGELRRLDLALPRGPLSTERLEPLVETALAELPEAVCRLLGEVPVVIEDYPSAELVQAGVDPRQLAVFAGAPPAEAGAVALPPRLDAVLLFARNIERAAGSEAEAGPEISAALIEEAVDFFDLDDEQLAELDAD